MTKANICHSSHTDFISVEVQQLRTKIKLLENSEELHKVRLHKMTIELTLKDYSLARLEYFVERYSLMERCIFIHLYTLFNFNPLQNRFPVSFEDGQIQHYAIHIFNYYFYEVSRSKEQASCLQFYQSIISKRL